MKQERECFVKTEELCVEEEEKVGSLVVQC